MIAFWLLWPADTKRSAFGAGWWFGFGYFAVTLRWIVSPFLVDVQATGWMAPFGLLAMAGGGAVFWGIARWAAFRLAPGSLCALALMLAGVEALRSLILTGFPWALIGHVLIDTPLAQLAAFGGPHLLTLVTLVICYCFALIVRRNWIGFAGPIVVLAVWWTMIPPPIVPAERPIVRLIQPNAPQSEKWDPVKSQIFFARMIEMTGAGARPDLVVWPETSVASLLEYAGEELVQISDAARGAPTVLGINRRKGTRYYNAALVVERGAIVSSVYDKAHIVPFGEYIPGGEVLSRFGINGFAASNGQAFSSGPGASVVDIPGIGPARPLICYEGIFAEEIGTDTRPRLMILITNDAWFGPSAGPRQHLAQARLRTIEQGVPMARAANTGISAMIDAYGRVIAQTQMDQEAWLDVPLPDVRPPTLYSRWGDLPVLLALLLGCATCGVVGRVNSRLTKDT